MGLPNASSPALSQCFHPPGCTAKEDMLLLASKLAAWPRPAGPCHWQSAFKLKFTGTEHAVRAGGGSWNLKLAQWLWLAYASA